VRGPTVIRGYWGDPAATGDAIAPDGWLRTGDCAFVENGRLTITGRSKDVVIVHGANLYSHEIEAVAAGPEVAPSTAVAFATREYDDETDRLTVVFSPRDASTSTLDEAMRAIANRVHAVIGVRPYDVVAVRPSDIPRTSIGKLQRGELRLQLANGRIVPLGRMRLNRRRGLAAVTVATEVWVKRARVAAGRRRPDFGIALVPASVVGRQFGQSLRRHGRWVLLHPGDRFAPVAPDEFTVRPLSRDDFDRVMRAAVAVSSRLDRLVYAWTLKRDAEGEGHCPLVVAAQAAAARLDLAECGVFAVADGLHPVEGAMPSPEHAALVAIADGLAADDTRLFSVTLDADLATDVDHTVAAVADEIVMPAGDGAVSLRNGARWVRRFAPVSLDYEQDASPLGRGLVLVTGGLGGVGFEVVSYLLANHDVQVIILGRRTLNADDASRTRLRELRRLGPVTYEAADVRDAASVDAAVARAEAVSSRRLRAAFHLAGERPLRSLFQIEPEEVDRAASAKLSGLDVVAHAASRRGAFVVAFSSVHSAVPSPRFGLYAAANRMMEARARQLHAYRDIDVRVLAWSMWRGVGIAADLSPMHAAHVGLQTREPGELVEVMRAALASNHTHVFVGIELNAPTLRAEAVHDVRALDAIFVEAPLGSGTEPSTITDPFGNDVPVVAASSGPATVTNLPSDVHQPEVEQIVREAWRSVLACDVINPNDSFFDLGGDSITMLRVQERLASILSVEVPLEDLLAASTPRDLAALLVSRSAGVTTDA
jgi:NADP-dependent 3-hydroxy acid dehydrogenase YdfG/acyl carrier protein